MPQKETAPFGEGAADFTTNGFAETGEKKREYTSRAPFSASPDRRTAAETALQLKHRPTQTPTPGQTQPTNPPLTAQDVLACLDLLSRRRAAQVARFSSVTKLRGVQF